MAGASFAHDSTTTAQQGSGGGWRGGVREGGSGVICRFRDAVGAAAAQQAEAPRKGILQGWKARLRGVCLFVAGRARPHSLAADWRADSPSFQPGGGLPGGGCCPGASRGTTPTSRSTTLQGAGPRQAS